MKFQNGFTIVELLVTLTLGLIITSAALLLFLSGQKNIALQKDIENLQEDQNFGLSYIAKNIRQTNLQNSSAAITKDGIGSGVVFSKANIDIVDPIPSGTGPQTTLKRDAILEKISNFDNNVATIMTTVDSNVIVDGESSPLKNDQLVIQYRPAEDNVYDCMGNLVNSDYIVVERYFVRVDSNSKGTTDEERTALACAAGKYKTDGTSTAAELSLVNTDGQIIMKHVDLFKIKFHVQPVNDENAINKKQYLTANEFRDKANLRILAVQLAVIVRADSATTDPAVSEDKKFTLFDKDKKVLVNTDALTKKYVRTPIIQTIAFRNALGERS